MIARKDNGSKPGIKRHREEERKARPSSPRSGYPPKKTAPIPERDGRRANSAMPGPCWALHARPRRPAEGVLLRVVARVSIIIVVIIIVSGANAPGCTAPRQPGLHDMGPIRQQRLGVIIATAIAETATDAEVVTNPEKPTVVVMAPKRCF